MLPDKLKRFLKEQGISEIHSDSILSFIEQETINVMKVIDATLQGDSVALETIVPSQSHQHSSSSNLTIDLFSDDFEEENQETNTTPTASESVNWLGRYELLGELGQGGMGKVYRVKDPQLNRHLAMKVVHPKMMKHKAALARFIEEGQVGAQLQHPNIIPVYELGALEDGRIYFTMKEIQGREFSEMIKAVQDVSTDGEWKSAPEGWSFHQLIDVFYQVCSAISYAHTSGVIHRDLKPANIMIGAFGEVLVVDWGIAKVIGRTDRVNESSIVTNRTEGQQFATRMGQITGTPAYMAPEQAEGLIDQIDHRSDIYSLGIILHVILNGHLPNTSRRRTQEFKIYQSTDKSNKAAAKEDIQPDKKPAKEDNASRHLPTVPDELREACAKAMQEEPAHRYQSTEELMQAIKDWLDGARKKERAQELVRQARESQALALSAEKQAQEWLTQVESKSAALQKGAKSDEKHEIWDMESKAQDQLETALQLKAKRLRLLRGALVEFARSTEALGDLAAHCIMSHREAMKNKRLAQAQTLVDEAQGYLEKLPEEHPIKKSGQAYFAAEGMIDLTLEMPAEFTIERFDTHRKRLIPVEVNKGQGERYRQRLPVGSYQLRAKSPESTEVIYPFFIEHGQDWSVNSPSGDTLPLRLPSQQGLGEEERYVPAGWFYAGGDPDAPNGLPESRAWSDGFIIGQKSVTHAEYIAFLNDLLSKGEAEKADCWAPREQSNSERELGQLIYELKDGVYAHPLGEKMNRHPVVHVTWFSALAYSHWLAQKTGQPWRLPLELEWEKAARGVDRRRFPWGDDFDSAFCIMMNSHVGKPTIESVDHNAFDKSVYGVMSCAGNTREWCLDTFDSEALPIAEGRLKTPSRNELMSTEFKSSRGGSFGNASTRTRSADRDWWFPHLSYIGRGFRVARSWPETDSSLKLQENIESVLNARRYKGGIPVGDEGQ